MEKEVIIDSFTSLNTSLNEEEIKELSKPNNERLNFIGIIIYREKGFLNKILFRKKMRVYINGVNNVDVRIQTPSTMTWWSKSGQKQD